MLRRLAPVLVAMLAVLAACQSTPAITDPVEIITQGLDATANLKSFHVSVALDGSFTVPDGGGSFALENTTVEADVDVSARSAHLTFAVPSFLSLSGEVIVIGPDVWIKTSMTGPKWTHQGNELTASAVPSPSFDIEAVIDKVRDFLSKEGVVTSKLADVACGDRQCYQVSVKVPSDLLAEESAGAVASMDPSTIFGEALELNLLFDREKLWLTEASTSVDSETFGAVNATVSFSNFDEAVTFSPPPSADVTEGEFSIPGM